MTKISKANIVLDAFHDPAIGSKVIHEDLFFETLRQAVEQTDFTSQEREGQAVVNLDSVNSGIVGAVLSGVGTPPESPEITDYNLRKRRGSVRKYLSREYALQTQRVDAVVYTRKAYLLDPDVDSDEENRIQEDDPDYVLVAVLASPDQDQESPMRPGRLVRNLAGANNVVEEWTKSDIIEKAKESVRYWDGREVVAD